jgi:Uma2 family endonuclease
MAQVIESPVSEWTAADVVERFGAIPLWRIRSVPAPGTATEEDVVAVEDREDRLCELVDGILVEKVMGAYESYLAMFLGRLLGDFVAEHDLGVILGEAGMLRLAPGLVRIPDVAFLSWQRFPGRRISRESVWGLAPDVAIEIISKSNTPKEMSGKLVEYFTAGAQQVWYVYPDTCEVRVYAAPDACTTFAAPQTLVATGPLAGFQLDLRALFAEPAS